MNRKLAIIIVLLGALLLTGCMSASFSGNYVLTAGKTLHGNLFVTSGSVTLEENSRVTGTIMLTSGELHIGKNAQVGGDVVLTSGDLYLVDGAVIHGDVILSSSDIGVHQSPGATVEGNVTSDIAPFAIRSPHQDRPSILCASDRHSHRHNSGAGHVAWSTIQKESTTHSSACPGCYRRYPNEASKPQENAG